MAPEDQTTPEPAGAVTAADHEAGFKDLTVTLRTGASQTLRLHAPPALEALTLYRASLKGEDVTNMLLLQCVKPDQRETLDRLDMDALAEALGVAMALAWGMEKQKKMLAAAQAILGQSMPSPSRIAGARSGSRWLARAWVYVRRLIGRGRA